MSLTSGSPLPDVTQTTTAKTEAPGYFSDYLSGLAQAGQSSLYQPGTFDSTTGKGTLKTGEQLVAGYDPLQTSGYGKFESAADAYKPGLQTAQSNLAQGSGISSQDISNFLNPYTTNVVNEMERLAQQNVQRNLLPSMKAGFVGSGGLGSQRYANALGQSLADVQSNLTGQQYGALSAGYKQALDAAMQEAGLQQRAAEVGSDIAAREQSLGLTGAGALTKAGAERQAYQQSVMDAPLKQAANAAALMRGYQVPVTTTETFKGPKAGLYSMSPLQSILGIGSLLGSAGQGSLLGQLGSGIAKAFTGGGGGGGGYYGTEGASNDVAYGGASPAEQDAINNALNQLNNSSSITLPTDSDYAWEF
jgi:hypothetical protein